MGRKRSKEKAPVMIAVAAGLVLVLLAAGTVLRMKTHDLGLWQAFRSFVRDTFTAVV